MEGTNSSGSLVDTASKSVEPARVRVVSTAERRREVQFLLATRCPSGWREPVLRQGSDSHASLFVHIQSIIHWHVSNVASGRGEWLLNAFLVVRASEERSVVGVEFSLEPALGSDVTNSGVSRVDRFRLSQNSESSVSVSVAVSDVWVLVSVMWSTALNSDIVEWWSLGESSRGQRSSEESSSTFVDGTRHVATSISVVWTGESVGRRGTGHSGERVGSSHGR